MNGTDDNGSMPYHTWVFAWGLDKNGTLLLSGWDRRMNVRESLKRLRVEHPLYEWRSRKEIVQNQKIHYIEMKKVIG
tara:strand:- start:113 stop:343 length:231 start_codon:yes stop_codon:yes gene_type:complete